MKRAVFTICMIAGSAFAGSSQYNTPERDDVLDRANDICYLGATNLVESISTSPSAITNFNESFSGAFSTANPTNGTITVGRDGDIIITAAGSFSANLAVDVNGVVAIDGAGTGYGFYRDIDNAGKKGSFCGGWCGPVTNGQVISVLVTGDNTRTLTYQSLSIWSAWQD